MSFAQLLTVFQGFLSRGFWFGSFLPVALAGVLHAVLAHRVFPNASPLQWLLVGGSKATQFPLVFAAAVVVAYAMTPLLPWVRGMLDGSLLPGWLHDRLRQEHASRARRTRDAIGQAYLRYGQFQNLRPRWAERLRDARHAGQQLPAPLANASALIENAQSDVHSLRQALANGMPVEPDRTETTCLAVRQALCAADAESNATLDWCHRTLLTLLADLELDARHRADAFAERSGAAASLLHPQATRMADARRLIERYSEDAYGVLFEFLWPRLQLQLPDTGASAERMVTTKAQADFALLSMLWTVSVAVIWMPMLAWRDDSPWWLLGLGVLTPLALAFFYELAVQSELANAELVRTLVDRYRFDVIKNVLRLPLPATLAAERDLWLSVAKSQTPGLQTNLSYRHPSA
jgi:hypothetical protein